MKKIIFYCLFLFFSINFIFGYNEFNSQGDFLVSTEKRVVNYEQKDIEHTFILNIRNKLSKGQRINLEFENQDGWELELDKKEIFLEANEVSKINFKIKTIPFEEYEVKISGRDEKISAKKSEHLGLFQFPIKVSGIKDKVNLTLGIKIKSPILSFSGEIVSFSVSPNYPLVYTLKAENFEKPILAKAIVTLDGKLIDEREIKFENSFGKKSSLKVLSVSIPKSFEPKNYNARIVISPKDLEKNLDWSYSEVIRVINYENIEEKRISSFSIFGEKNKVTIKNVGNVKSTYKNSTTVFWFEKFFFSSTQNYKYENNSAIFEIELESEEEVSFEYSFNFLSLYLLVLLVFLLYAYHLYKIYSNPLKVETQIYQIKKIENEGIKSLKFKIGFENIKLNEIHTLKVIFRNANISKC